MTVLNVEQHGSSEERLVSVSREDNIDNGTNCPSGDLRGFLIPCLYKGDLLRCCMQSI